MVTTPVKITSDCGGSDAHHPSLTKRVRDIENDRERENEGRCLVVWGWPFVIVLSVLSGWTCMCVCIVCFMTSNEPEKRLIYDIGYQLRSVYARRSKWYFFGGRKKGKMIKNGALGEKWKKKDETRRVENVNVRKAWMKRRSLWSHYLSTRDA